MDAWAQYCLSAKNTDNNVTSIHATAV